MALDREDVRLSWVPVKTASRMLGVSRQRVYALARAGMLGTMEVDGVRLISSRSVQARVALMRAKKGGRRANR